MSRGAPSLGPGPGRGQVLALTVAATFVLGCAPIDVSSTVSVRPRGAPVERFGGEQLSERDFVAEYVQLGPRLLVEVREHRSCVRVRHVPVMRVEDIHRSNRGFVIWDFVLGSLTGGFAALAFARPQLFGDRLVNGEGRLVYDSSSAYIVGGVFAAISVGLLAAGVVDAVRSTDTTRYAEAYELERGPAQPCSGDEAAGEPVRERSLRLVVGDGELELEARTDREGRARFELPAWDGPGLTDGPAPVEVPAVIEVARAGGSDVEPRVLVLSLRVPFAAAAEAHTGVADTRRRQEAVELPPLSPAGGPALEVDASEVDANDSESKGRSEGASASEAQTDAEVPP